MKLYKQDKLPQKYQEIDPPPPLGDAIPPNYVVKRETGEEIVMRVRWISPGRSEDFALRKMLREVPCLSFADTRTVAGIEYATFREAAVARGLYADGDEFHLAMQQAIAVQHTQEELRRLLVMCFQEGANPFALYVQFKAPMMEDIQHGDEAQRVEELQIRLHRISQRHGGKLLMDFPRFPVPTVVENATEAGTLSLSISALQSNRQRRARIEQKYGQLGPQQRAFVNEVLQHMRNRRSSSPGGNMCKANGGLFFLQGEAGTGKTFLLKVLKDMADLENMPCQTTATTGIAATMYEGGRTLHSLLGLGVQDSDSSSQDSHGSSRFSPNSQRALYLRKLHFLIVDEASMLSRLLLELMDVILKDLRDPYTGEDSDSHRFLFGGLTVVLAGDFRQLLTVVKGAVQATPESDMGTEDSRHVASDLVNKLLFSSDIWVQHGKIRRLTQQMRQESDPHFASLLRDVGKGLYSTNHLALPLESTPSVTRAYKWLWPWIESGDAADVSVNRLLVAPVNSLVDAHQAAALSQFPGEMLPPLIAACEVTKVRANPATGPNGENEESIVPEMLLKIGVPVMIIRNVLFPHLVNGKVMVLRDYRTNLLVLEDIDERTGISTIYLVSRINFVFRYGELQVLRRQFPVRLALAATVHKSQSRTLNRVVVDLRKDFFCAGMLYVALSRVRRAQDLLILRNETEGEEASEEITMMPFTVRNPILREALEFANRE